MRQEALSIRPPAALGWPFSGRIRRNRTDLSIHDSGLFARYPQIAQGEQRLDLRGVLGQAAVAYLDESALTGAALYAPPPRCPNPGIPFQTTTRPRV